MDILPVQDLANDLEDERTARIIAEEAASANQQQADAALAEADSLRDQLALLLYQLKTRPGHSEVSDAPIAQQVQTQSALHAPTHMHSNAAEALTGSEARHVVFDEGEDRQAHSASAERHQPHQAASAQPAAYGQLQQTEQLRTMELATAAAIAGKEHNRDVAAAEAEALHVQLQTLTKQLESQQLQEQQKHAELQEHGSEALAQQKAVYQSQLQQLQSQHQVLQLTLAQQQESETQLKQANAAELARLQQQVTEQQQEPETQLKHTQASELVRLQQQLTEQQREHERIKAEHGAAAAQLRNAHNAQLEQLQQQLAEQEVALQQSKAAQQHPAAVLGKEEEWQGMVQQLAAWQASTRELEAKTQELEAQLSAAQQHASMQIEASTAAKEEGAPSRSGKRVTEPSTDAEPVQAIVAAEPDAEHVQATVAAEPDAAGCSNSHMAGHMASPVQASAGGSPHEASTSAVDSQPTTTQMRPDQAAAMVSDFQIRLQSMLPQLPDGETHSVQVSSNLTAVQFCQACWQPSARSILAFCRVSHKSRFLFGHSGRGCVHFASCKSRLRFYDNGKHRERLCLQDWWEIVGREIKALLQSRHWAQAQVGPSCFHLSPSGVSSCFQSHVYTMYFLVTSSTLLTSASSHRTTILAQSFLPAVPPHCPRLIPLLPSPNIYPCPNPGVHCGQQRRHSVQSFLIGVSPGLCNLQLALHSPAQLQFAQQLANCLLTCLCQLYSPIALPKMPLWSSRPSNLSWAHAQQSYWHMPS